MRVMFACLCDYASTDEHGKLSACGIFDRIAQRRFPARLARMFFVLRLAFDYDDNDKKNELVVELIDADGQPHSAQSYRIEHDRVLPGAFNTLNIVLELTDTTLAQPGRYIWVLKTDGEKSFEVPFDVEQVPQQGQ